MKLYNYVGPQEIADAVSSIAPGFAVLSPAALMQWLKDDRQHADGDGHVIATFVVDRHGTLRVADRCSEHVACAGGQPVLSAGEITFQVGRHEVQIHAVTNQSTGYCPEPASWPQVAAAIGKAGLPAPAGFHVNFLFRKCSQCHALNLIKENVFVCAMCDARLPAEWNLA
ncbi:hypothetical protein INH39_29005 [Massilia violaceinigra]|uniref:Uncharacterized protein n=1 Tax=Massilia violaceinigra TaxID=2045208 RepID=A0ABY4A5H5_9BURK|nr:hypothetical protein [Massilia violaceinigra]UOD29400.1 hypothetical protein INH39_29005 [Massilia violaceinigra]